MIILNEKEIKIEKFPNNEIRIRNIINLIKEQNLIEFKYENSDDLISLLFIKSKIDDLQKETNLYIRYMPYSRMDREFENDLFLLKYISNYINNLNFNKVFILEPHSKETEKLINNIHPIYIMEDFIKQVKSHINEENIQIIFPDEGSFKRYNYNFDNYVVFRKRRNEETTNIELLEIQEGKIKPNTKAIIIDDLCSTGNTCNKVAKILKANKVKEVYVLAVHTENQVINKDIIKEDYVDQIFTTNSLLTKKHKKIRILNFNITN